MRELIDASLATIPGGSEVEIAFFGGSFTGIDRALMCRLLDLAESYVKTGAVSAIRLSTRPDYIDAEILSILASYSVKTVELGLQSMSQEVLAASKRGHTAQQARDACRAVVEAGFSLVGQMMIGLPESTPKAERETAKEICALGASAARIYPTVVFYDTPLEEMTRCGAYTPLSVADAAERSADALRIFQKNNIPCIRIGLCATEDLLSLDTVMAGPNHPALGELVWNAYYYKEIKEALEQRQMLGAQVLLTINEKELSKVIGQKRSNLVRLERETGTKLRVVGQKEHMGMSFSLRERV